MSNITVKKIFVVDDNVMLTMLMEDYLTSHTPHEVEVYSTGEECIDNLHRNPDVIILDFNLNSENPDAANGEQIMATIKATGNDIHFIMLSGQEGDNAILEKLADTGDNYVVKGEAAFADIVHLIMERN